MIPEHIHPDTIRHYDGHAFAFELPQYTRQSDDSANLTRSSLLIFEDDRLLGPRHAVHSEIAEFGAGRYSHWGTTIRFSTTDNSDPRTNGRTYSVLLSPAGLGARDLAIAAEALVEMTKAGNSKAQIEFILRYTEDRAFQYHDPLYELKEFMLRDLLRQQSMIYGGSVAVVRAFNRLRWWLNRLNVDLADKKILEVGPGRSAALGLLLVMAHAREYLGVDAFPSEEWWSPTVLESVVQIAKDFYPELDVARAERVVAADTATRVATDFPLRYALTENGRYPLPDNSVDLIFSVSVFEHVDDPDSSLREMYRVLRPGAVMVHAIDLAAHEPFLSGTGPYNPFTFLRYTDEEWAKMWPPENMKYYQNRWRKPDFLAAMRGAGFQVQEVWTERDLPANLVHQESQLPKLQAYAGITPQMRAEFAERFRSMSDADLEPMSLFVACRKPHI